MSSIYIVWFRQDLRLSDNPALFEASKLGQILPIYIEDPDLGAASRWWLSKSLQKLNASLEHKLQIFQGNPQNIILALVKKYQPVGVYWNRCYEPKRIKQDSEIKIALREQNINCQSFNASLLFEPWDILKSDKTPYRVFTPYYRSCLEALSPRKPLPAPQLALPVLKQDTPILAQGQDQAWTKKLESHWQIGEQAAAKYLDEFLENNLEDYAKNRDFPARESTSKLSPHLHFGEISPHQIWWSVHSKQDPFLRQLIWREFSYYLLFHFPHFPQKNYQSKFDHFPWQNNPELLKAWQEGRTGYPLVDAGMRELWQTGTMHNRVRMIVGSFLVKNLNIHWRHGAAWFWDCLVDADLANNSVSWQWVAGSGVDASPFFRIFNPTTQGEKFDPDGDYTRRYLLSYSPPIVDLKTSREQALKAFKAI